MLNSIAGHEMTQSNRVCYILISFLFPFVVYLASKVSNFQNLFTHSWRRELIRLRRKCSHRLIAIMFKVTSFVSICSSLFPIGVSLNHNGVMI